MMDMSDTLDWQFEAYEFLVDKMPKQLQCSVDKHEGYKSLPLEEAFRGTKFVQFNTPNLKNYLIVDIDEIVDDVEELIEVYNLPTPTFVVHTTRGLHLMWRLETAVSVKNPKALKYYNDIKKMLTGLLGGDFCFTNRVARNPLNNDSYFLNEKYCLMDFGHLLCDEYFSLFEELTGKKFRSKAKRASLNIDFTQVFEGERNNQLFSYARAFAYQNYEDLNVNVLLSELEEKNQMMPTPLGFNQVRNIAIGVYRWTQNFYVGSSEQKTKYNQELARKKAIKVVAILVAFIDGKLNEGFFVGEVGRMSLRFISKETGVSINSIRKYKHKLIANKVLDLVQKRKMGAHTRMTTFERFIEMNGLNILVGDLIDLMVSHFDPFEKELNYKFRMDW